MPPAGNNSIKLGETRKGGSEMSEELKARVKSFIEEGNLDAMDQLYADDVIHHVPPFPDVKGLKALKRANENMRLSFPDMQTVLHNILIDGDMIVTHFTWRGTNTGASKALPFPPTGKAVEWSGCFIGRLDGNKCVEEWGYADHLGLLQQLGLIPSM
jgi:steroid delta-isomerase-like uncharacterized protein